MASYWDVDSILSEEESVPCTTMFPFSNLAHLDPNFIPISDLNGSSRRKRSLNPDQMTLSEGSRIHMPLWSIEKWATLGFITMALPRHFGKKARDRLEADPASADLSRTERFYTSGIALIHLIHRWSSAIAKEMAKRNATGGTMQATIEQVLMEAEELRRILVSTYAGDRLLRTFDWSMTSFNDDVTIYTRRLTDIELRLFRRGTDAASAYNHWKNHGSRPIPVSSAILATKVFEPMRVVSPDPIEKNDGQGNMKRMRAT